MIPQQTARFARVNPSITIVTTGSIGSATGEVTVPLAGLVPVPPLTSMIRVYVTVTSLTGGGGARVVLRDLPGGSDVMQAVSPVLTIQGPNDGFLEANGGRVTYSAFPGGASTFSVQIMVTGFLRYA